MANLNPADNDAISSAIWSHPQGVSFTTKLTQIAECCQRMGQKRSGVTRLWMYQLYEDAIQEDLKKKQEKENETVQQTAQTRQNPAQKAKVKPRRTHQEPREHKVIGKPLPRYAPAFVMGPSAPDIEHLLAKLDPLPILKSIKVNVDAEINKVKIIAKRKKKQKQEEELLLLLAA